MRWDEWVVRSWAQKGLSVTIHARYQLRHWIEFGQVACGHDPSHYQVKIRE